MNAPAAATPPNGPLCTCDSIAADLRALGIQDGETLLVHSSLSSLGWVVGGPVAVVQALIDVLGPAGTLAVPTQTAENSDPAGWSNPPVPEAWWPTIRASTPAYDPHITPTLGVGVIPETVRTWPGALRSAHPQTSFAAIGVRAAEITDGHAWDCRFGERSPLARLEDAGARVLLLGTGYAACTAFHLAECRIPGPTEEVSFAAMTPQGRRWVTVRDNAPDSAPFDRLGADFERDEASPVQHGTVGAAPTRLFPLTAAVTYAEQWLTRMQKGTHQDG
ncbi:aminoglycoside N(3)-acetyltransferase [Streptomyces sp. NPDC002851]